MKLSKVYFEAKEKAVFRTEEFNPQLTGKQVLVKLDFDLISAGTELANYHGFPNTVAANQGFPHYPGYTASGHVIAAGPEAKKFKPGDRVVANGCGHRSLAVRDDESFYPVPEGILQEDAAAAYLASFPFLGVRKLNIQLGEAVMVAGLGLLGQIAIQLAKASGACPVLACDFSPERRALALKLGADYVLDPREPDFIAKVKKLTDGRGPECVVEVTGFISALQQALEYIAWEGRITLLGCTRVSDQTIDFYKYVHLRGISLTGCHTSTRPSVDSMPGKWTYFDDFRTFFKLIKAGRLNVEPLISHVVSPRDAAQIYAGIGGEKNPPLGMLFDWRDIE